MKIKEILQEECADTSISIEDIINISRGIDIVVAAAKEIKNSENKDNEITRD